MIFAAYTHLSYGLFPKISHLAQEASRNHLWNCHPINGVKRCLCYITSVNFKRRSRRPPWHRGHPYSRGFQSRWKLPLCIFRPLCQSVTESRHTERSHSHRSTSFHSWLCLFRFISCFWLTHVSAAPRVMTSHLQQLRTKNMKSEPQGEWQYIVLMQNVLEQSLHFPRDVSILSDS